MSQALRDVLAEKSCQSLDNRFFAIKHDYVKEVVIVDCGEDDKAIEVGRIKSHGCGDIQAALELAKAGLLD